MLRGQGRSRSAAKGVQQRLHILGGQAVIFSPEFENIFHYRMGTVPAP
jgi:hypothetical protein